MKTNNRKLIKLLGILGILESEAITKDSPKTWNDITYTISNIDGSKSTEYRILPNSVDDETVGLLLKAEQLKTLRSIQSMLKFFVILTIISLACASLIYVFILSQNR